MMNQPQGSKAPESSTMSRSQSFESAVSRKDIIQGSTTFLDKCFPLFDEMLKNSSLPSILYYVLCVYSILQFIAVSLWPGIDTNANYDENTWGKIIKVILQITFITDFSRSSSSYLTSFIICIVLCAFLIILIIIQFVIYNQNRRFIPWTLYLTRFSLEFIPTIVIIPMGNFVGMMFAEITEKDSPIVDIIFFAFSIVFWGMMISIFYLQSHFFAVTTYIPSTPVACWDGQIYFGLWAYLALFTFLSYVLSIFQNWLEILLIIGKIVYSIYIIYESFYLPFIVVDSNVLIGASFTTSCILDVIAIVKIAAKVKIPFYVDLIIGIVFNIIAAAIILFIQKRSYKKVAKLLSASCLENLDPADQEILPPPIQNNSAQLVTLQDPNKRLLLQMYGLDRHKGKCEYYIRVGLAQRCDLFLDWSLFKFMAEVYNDNETFGLIVQMLSYFPSEYRLLNCFFSLTLTKVNLHIAHRFLLYQVHRVMGLRQSSVSSEITDKLIEIKHLSIKGVNAVRGFWKEIPASPDIFLQVKQFTDQTCSLFRESMEKWPNNSRLCDDYSKFLIECGTDFCEGVKMKHRADLIDQGKNFVVDLCFRSMVRVYPLYLKRSILDVKGNFIKMNVSNKQSSMSVNSNSQLSTGTIDGELDIEIEEEISRSLFTHHRLRLAFQRALENRSCIYSKLLKMSAVFTVLLLCALVLFLFFYYRDLYLVRQQNMDRLLLAAQMRYGLDASLLATLIYWSHTAGTLPPQLYKDMQIPSPVSNKFNLDLTQDALIPEVIEWCSYGRAKLEDFLDQMVQLAASGDDVRSYMGPMFEKTTPFSFCINSKPLPQSQPQSLQNGFTYIFLRLRELMVSPIDSETKDVIYPNVSQWNESENLCEIFSNIPNMRDSFELLMMYIANDQNTRREETQKQNYLILIVLVVVYTVTTTPLLVIFTIKFYHELLFLLNLMDSIDDDTKAESSRPFKDKQNNEENNETSNEHLTKGKVNPGALIAVFIISLIIGNAIFIGVVFLAQSQNDTFLNLNIWLFQGAQRAPLIMEALINLVFVLVLTRDNPLETDMINISIATEQAQRSLNKLKSSNDVTLRGTDGIKGVSNYSTELDAIHYGENCLNENVSFTSLHKSYECASLDSAITTFIRIGNGILRAPKDYSLTVGSDFFHLFHLANVHMLDPCYEAAILLNDNSQTLLSSFRTTLLILTIVGIVYSIAIIFIFWALVIKLDRAFDGGLQLLRRIPPISCNSNPRVLNYLLHKKTEKANDKMTASKSVIMNSRDAILCLHRNESIEVVNQTVSNFFGYTPEQLLGQPISCILPQEEASEVFHHLTLMRTGQCPLTYETTTVGKTDDDQNLPIHVTVLGISEDGSSASSFALIIRDETQLQKHRQEAEEAKAQSENLLYQILPRDIVVRLNQGETDISFSVPSATIIFIDIQKWSDYSATLSPAQIMSNLSIIFAKFDTCCGRYNLIQKIKLIGDVYMAAAGLFTPNEPPVNHAQQVVQFGLDSLQALEEANSILDSSLQVRIGVNTDGPLIAGVLGTDKPVFDIIGDPINVAARLQSTCIPSTVQISQTTYDLVSELNFNIEQRGEIMLKGKGKKMAYIVRPITSGSFFLQNENDNS